MKNTPTRKELVRGDLALKIAEINKPKDKTRNN